MPAGSPLPSLFLLNATVLIAHQIDAAFWHEWDLFHIPGGNQVNLLLNLPIIALVLFAHRAVISGSSRARSAHWLLAGLGYLTAILHTSFFVAGHVQFWQPMSLLLLASTAALSTLQVLALRADRHIGR